MGPARATKAAVGRAELPLPLEEFLASRSLDALLSTGHYHGSGEVARQLRAATAAWAASQQQGPAPVGAFAAALFAKVKSFPEAAAALAAADAGASLDRLVQRLEPVLQDLKQLSRPAERQRISTQLMLGCLAKLELVAYAPDFRIDRYGLAVSPYAPRSSPFARHVDHRLPVACGGATDAGNLEAVQHRFNHCKRDRIIDPELHRWDILGKMEPHTYVTAAQLRQLAAELEAQGKQPSYYNVEALLRCTPPWSAHYASSNGCSSSGARELAVRSEAGRLAEGRRRREMWSAEEEQALAVAAAKQELQAISHGGSGRMCWEAVAAELGTGRSGEQCRNKWRRLLQRQGSDEGEAAEQSGEEEGAGSVRQRGYGFWFEEEADAAVQLLGAVGYKLAADNRFGLTARALPAKLEAACQELWHMPLAQRLPGRTAAQVAEKCRAMAGFAIQLALNKQQLCKQYRPDRGLTPQQWQHLAPHLLLLAGHLPLGRSVHQLVASGEAKEEVRRFVEDPPREGEPRLPQLRDYWPPVAPEPAAEAGVAAAAAKEAAGAVAGGTAGLPTGAAGTSAGETAGAARRAAAGGEHAAGKPAAGGRGPAAPPAAKVAAATPAGSLAEAVIDLTLLDSDDEGTQAGATARQSGSVKQSMGTAAPTAAGQGSGQSGSGSSSGRCPTKSSQAAAGRAALGHANQQQAAASSLGHRKNRKTTEEERQGIFKLWLRHGNQWERIRQAVERDPALCSFLQGCSGNKTKAQIKIKDLARKWVQPAEQQAQQQGSGQPSAA